MLYFRKKVTEIEVNIVSLWQKLKEYNYAHPICCKKFPRFCRKD